MLRGPLGTDLAPGLLALVGLLLQPNLNGLPTVPHVTAHPIADRTVALVPPAIQGVTGMPNISETSVSDISLSPAWSVMIIFLSWMAVREHFRPAESA